MDDATRTVMELLAKAFPAVETMAAVDARAAVRAMPRPPTPPLPVGTVDDDLIDGLPVRVYRPEDHGPGTPTMVLFHGGGFVLGDVEGYDGSARALCLGTGATVVSVDYRLAPEDPFPAAVEDAIAAVRWATNELGGPIGVTGDSAGGNLAAVAALLARDEGIQIAHQLLVYPLLDPTCAGPSHRASAKGWFLTEAAVRWFWAQYLPGHDGALDPRVAPAVAELTGVAPATIVVAEHDPLLDDGLAYATALEAAGVAVDLRQAHGMFHGFFGVAAALPAAAAIRDDVYRAVGTALRA